MGSKTPGINRYTFQHNAENTYFATTDSGLLHKNSNNAIPLILNNDYGNLVPTLSFIVEF